MRRKSIYIEIIPKGDFDFSKVVVDHANGRPIDLSNCYLKHINDPIFDLKDDFIKYITENGFTNYTKLQWIFEDLTTPCTPPIQIESLLIRYLTNIGIDNELIIIDPYFFPPKIDNSYLELLLKILQPFAHKISCLRVVTAEHDRAFSLKTKLIVETEIKKEYSSIGIIHTMNNCLHDRFWISNKRQKGIMIGTSLNGLGKKYSMVDYLTDQDVAAIISEFRILKLI